MTSAYQNVFSVDLEDWYQGIEIDIDDWEAYAPRISEGLFPLLDLLDEADTKATFFVLGYQAEQTPELIQRISESGHDIASHGYSHRFVYQQTRNEFQLELRKSKAILEDLCGKAVIGYRAPFFSITKNALWALDVLVEEGFKYDSSLFPVKNYRYGLASADRSPGWITTPSGSELFEIPLSTVKLPVLMNKPMPNIPMSGGGYFRLYPYALTKFLINRLNNDNTGLVFYMHPWEYDPDHPKVNFPRWFPKFTHYLNLHTSKPKTKRLLQDFPFTTIKEAYESKYLNPKANATIAPALFDAKPQNSP